MEKSEICLVWQGGGEGRRGRERGGGNCGDTPGNISTGSTLAGPAGGGGGGGGGGGVQEVGGEGGEEFITICDTRVSAFFPFKRG